MIFEEKIVGIWQADFLDTLQKVASMGGADLILTSPPYLDARTYGNNVCWHFEDYQKLGDGIKSALKPGGHCILNLDAPVREWRPGFGSERGFHPWKVMIDWAERVGLRVPDRLAYGRMGQPGQYVGRFRNDWEPLLWFQEPSEKGYFDIKPLVVKVPPYKNSGNLRERDGSKTKKQPATKYSDTRNPGTYWNYGTTGCGHDDPIFDVDHPARFCLKLASDVVRCFCPPDGLVVDPFLGSGTTMIAALDHGRRFAGGDLLTRPQDDKPWVDIAQDLAKKRYAQQDLFST